MTTLFNEQFSPFRNVLEPLVTNEVIRQMENQPLKLMRYLDPNQVIAYALNRLPALYATSVEGWNWQQQRAKDQLAGQICVAVRQGLAAVQRDPLKLSTPLMFSEDEDSELRTVSLASVER
ncbi:MAG: late competence development ComFB family protein [Microcoleus vaginatus WJT46-NPBG5]|nr:late competence development ComFB family protein [Microcoleus vaginatus WJT46-NPBG5]